MRNHEREMSNVLWDFKGSNDHFKLRVSERIRKGHMKEVTFDQKRYEMMRK